MFGIGIESIKLYGLIALGFIASGLLVIFKLRGMKIDKLENKLNEMVLLAKANKEKAQQIKRIKIEKEKIQNIVDEANKEKEKIDSFSKKLLDESKKNPDTKYNIDL